MKKIAIMHRIVPVLISIIFALSPVIVMADDESFDDFLKESQQGVEKESQEFNQYMTQLQKEFDDYKRIVEEEYANYKNEILKQWKEAEVSDNKKWVEYSPDYKTKRIVDFEKGYIEVDVIADKKGGVDKKQFGRILNDLLLEDKQTAFKRDTLSNNIEKRIIEKAEHIKTDEVKSAPILSPTVMGAAEPTKDKVIKTVVDLLKNAVFDTKPAKNTSTDAVFSLKVSLPSKGMARRAEQYKPVISSYADKQNIDASLVLAVTHTESAFNPMATSHVPAYGLMQIVPKSAGKDATAHLFGKPVLLAPSYLYNDENNINVGTAYLHLLFHSYLKSIDNLESRLYCAIAAYNTGPGNVAKAFTGKRNLVEAAKIINDMVPADVYNTLINKLPYDETRHYLKKVSERIVAYKR